jgi:cytidylate kinase
MHAREPVRIITISRDYGSGGGELAQRVGKALDWRVIDRALIQEVARRIQAPEEEIAPLDEHVGGIIERIAGVFARGVPEAPVMGGPDADMIAALERAVLHDALNILPFVVVGHGGQCFFSRRPDAFHVRVVAPREVRTHRVAERKRLDAAVAAREIERHDAERKRYIQHHFGCDANDPRLYNLQVDTGFFTLDEATHLILQAVAWHEASPAPVTI